MSQTFLKANKALTTSQVSPSQVQNREFSSPVERPNVGAFLPKAICLNKHLSDPRIFVYWINSFR